MKAEERVVVVYMDKVDWDHEIGYALGGNKVFPSVPDLKRHNKCWTECGIVEVEVKLKRVVLHSDFSGKRNPKAKGKTRKCTAKTTKNK